MSDLSNEYIPWEPDYETALQRVRRDKMVGSQPASTPEYCLLRTNVLTSSLPS
ncbi:MAG TPA: hypothetical protein VF914_16360 [Chloroflexia bacterium]|jgi:hypothetical protein